MLRTHRFTAPDPDTKAVGVKFDRPGSFSGSKTYYYLCPYPSVEVGDRVLVNSPSSGLVDVKVVERLTIGETGFKTLKSIMDPLGEVNKKHKHEQQQKKLKLELARRVRAAREELELRKLIKIDPEIETLLRQLDPERPEIMKVYGKIGSGKTQAFFIFDDVHTSPGDDYWGDD